MVWNYDYKDIEVDTSRFYDIGATVMSLKFKLSKYLSDFSTQIDKINIESSQKGVSQITLEHKQTEVRV